MSKTFFKLQGKISFLRMSFVDMTFTEEYFMK